MGEVGASLLSQAGSSALPSALHINFLFLQPSNKWRQNLPLSEGETESPRTKGLPLDKLTQVWVWRAVRQICSRPVPEIGLQRHILNLTLEDLFKHI